MRGLGYTKSIHMPSKFFKQRFTDRFLDIADLGNQAGAKSFQFRGQFSTSIQSATWLNPGAAGRAPTQTYVGGKTPTRGDSILLTDFDIPTYSKILGAQMYLTHSAAPSANHTFTGLTIALYPDLQSRDVDKWRGRKGSDHVWIRNQRLNNDRVTQIDNDAGNFWVKIQEGATIRAQTASAAAAVATQGAMNIGQNRNDEPTGVEGTYNVAFGQVVQIEASSSLIDRVLLRVRRQGSYTGSVNVVAKIYDYDVVTRTIGALRATSNAVDASTLTTSTTTETTFTFGSSVTVTLNEYVFVSMEAETDWGTISSRGNGFVIAGFVASLDNANTGANPAGSEEVMWCKTTPGGNLGAYFQIDQTPCLYSGTSGKVFECYPYQRIAEESYFRTRPTVINEVSILDLPPRLLRAIENYNRDKEIDHDVKGVMWYLATALGSGGVSNQGTLTWSTSPTATTGVRIYYRSTRTFIT